MLRFPASSKSAELLPLGVQEGQREATAWEAQRRGPWGELRTQNTASARFLSKSFSPCLPLGNTNRKSEGKESVRYGPQSSASWRWADNRLMVEMKEAVREHPAAKGAHARGVTCILSVLCQA